MSTLVRVTMRVDDDNDVRAAEAVVDVLNLVPGDVLETEILEATHDD